MYCESCGRKYPKGTIYCEYCGSKLKEDLMEEIIEDSFVKTEEEHDPIEEVKEEPKVEEPIVAKVAFKDQSKTNQYRTQPKCWSVFAKLGFAFGIISLILGFIPIVGAALGLELSIAGIVFSALGLRVYDEAIKGNAKAGLVMSIIATVFIPIMYGIYVTLAIASFN